MRVLEAKDFLVRQAADQAALENVPFSDLEKRMMYFTETGKCPEDPIALNEEFEGQYNTADYEKKISRLLHHAYKRVREERGADLQAWNDAIRRLRRGDHYLLVMWGQRPGIHAPELIGLLVGVLILAGMVGLRWVARQFEPPNPRLMLAIFLAVVLGCFFFPGPIGKAFGWLLDRTLFRFMDEKGNDGE